MQSERVQLHYLSVFYKKKNSSRKAIFHRTVFEKCLNLLQLKNKKVYRLLFTIAVMFASLNSISYYFSI